MQVYILHEVIVEMSLFFILQTDYTEIIFLVLYLLNLFDNFPIPNKNIKNIK